MKRRSHGVHGTNYVVHIRAPRSERTLCGRLALDVNCAAGNERVSEATCRKCAAKRVRERT